MIGGSPVFMPAMQPIQYVPQQGYARPRPQPQTAPRAPVYRGAMPKEQARPQPAKRFAPLRIPTPEELGVARAQPKTQPTRPAAASVPVARRPQPLDWAVTRRKLQDVGAVSFRLDQLPSGRSRFSVWLKSSSSPIQADGASETEAVRDCLERAKTQFAMSR